MSDYLYCHCRGQFSPLFSLFSLLYPTSPYILCIPWLSFASSPFTKPHDRAFLETLASPFPLQTRFPLPSPFLRYPPSQAQEEVSWYYSFSLKLFFPSDFRTSPTPLCFYFKDINALLFFLSFIDSSYHFSCEILFQPFSSGRWITSVGLPDWVSLCHSTFYPPHSFSLICKRRLHSVPWEATRAFSSHRPSSFPLLLPSPLLLAQPLPTFSMTFIFPRKSSRFAPKFLSPVFRLS